MIIHNILYKLLIIYLVIQAILIIYYTIHFINKHFLIKEIDYQKRYGENTWVLITGCSSGQGKLLAIEFAKRNFNIILAGNKKIKNTEKIINENYNVETKSIIVDFSNAYKPNFFDPFIKALDSIPNKLSILVNNIGHRVAWNPYHEMPSKTINDSIVCGTIVQAQLTKIALGHFIKRQIRYKSAIINITSMCTYSNIWFGLSGDICVPYMSVYEGANAFGFFHSNSIQKEYGDTIDVLNVTPGAVITENTTFLKNTPFCIKSEIFVKNILKLLGNYNGPQFAYWGHDLSSILSNFINNFKNNILKDTGDTISRNFMQFYYNS